jgi:hypothetical protein
LPGQPLARRLGRGQRHVRGGADLGDPLRTGSSSASPARFCSPRPERRRCRGSRRRSPRGHGRRPGWRRRGPDQRVDQLRPRCRESAARRRRRPRRPPCPAPASSPRPRARRR